MGRNESTVELLVKVWEGIREFLEVPNESTGFFFRHMRVDRSLEVNLKNHLDISYLSDPLNLISHDHV